MKCTNSDLENVSYNRISNIQQTLVSNPVLYIYSKDEDSLKRQEEQLMRYCDDWLLKPKMIYIDLGCPNFLLNKSNLFLLLSENSDTDIMITSVDRLTRKPIEVLELNKICEEKNIRIFETKNNDYLFLFDFNKDIKSKGDDYGL